MEFNDDIPLVNEDKCMGFGRVNILGQPMQLIY